MCRILRRGRTLCAPPICIRFPNEGRSRTVGPGPQPVKKSVVTCEKEYKFSQYHFLICPTRAAPGPFPEKGLDQKGQKGGYPPSALPPGAFTAVFILCRGRTLAAPSVLWAPPPSAGQWRTFPPCRGDPCGRPRPCKHFIFSCMVLHFIDRLRSRTVGPGPDGSFLCLLSFSKERRFTNYSQNGHEISAIIGYHNDGFRKEQT